MKRAVLLFALVAAAAGYAYLQTSTPRPNLARLMPAGALVYLEARDFGRLLREWDQSALKRDWLDSDNYEQFSRSNLFQKLGGLYQDYGAAAGFLPDLRTALGVAGNESALALYEVRELEFLYISRVGQSQLARSQLWALRDKFERRQSGGTAFYLRTDPAGGRTVAFAFANGYLFVATRDDLVARALALMAGGSDPSLASERWHQAAVNAAPTPGELRMLFKLESLATNVHFRSYWIQRNIPALRPYWAGVADGTRSRGAITETRVFLRSEESPAPAATPITPLLAVIPAQAGMYQAFGVATPRDAATLVIEKLIAPPMQAPDDWRFAPMAVSPDDQAGTEGDLETRIDEPALPADAGVSESVAALEALFAQAGVQTALLAQSSVDAGGPFVRTPAVIVLSALAEWDVAALRTALSTATGALWSASELGVGWTSSPGQEQIARLNGLGALWMAQRGHLLFLANDANLLRASLNARPGASPPEPELTYAAGFHHGRERGNFIRAMTALDSITASAGLFRFGDNAAPFFSGNIASVSRLLSRASAVSVTRRLEGSATKETIIYSLAPAPAAR